jgi:hypothetical protein
MNAKVLIAFEDKETHQKHKPGDVIDVTPARFNEITKKGRYIEAYVETEQKAATEKNK